MKLNIKLFLVSILLAFSSCVKDIDFNQAEDLILTPEVALALVNFEVTQNELVMGGVEVTSVTQTSIFDAFNNTIAQENLTRILFQIEAINTFDRDFTIDIVFLDEIGNITYTIPTLAISAEDENFSIEHEIVISTNLQFLTTEQVQITLNLQPSSDGSTIDPNIPNSLTFKSGGIFYLSI